MSHGIAQVEHGFAETRFNGLSDYEHDLTAPGILALMPPLLSRDFGELHRRYLAFDTRLKAFLTERAVRLNDFVSVEELRGFLAQPTESTQL